MDRDGLSKTNEIISTPEKVLIFQTAFLGDVILTLPLVEAIHQLWEKCQIHFVVNPAAKGILENHPYVNKIHIFDKRGESKGLGGLLAFSKELNKERFDIAFIPHRSFRSALTLYLTGIKTRIGFRGTPGSFLYTNRIERQKDQYEAARNIELLSLYESPAVFTSTPLLHEQPVILNNVEKVFGNIVSEKVIAFAPGSVWNTKKWPKEHWNTLAKRLTEDGHSVLLIGGPEDKALCLEIAQGNKDIVSTAGDMSILESVELIRNADLLITNDTAPLHMGVGARTPVLAIFGPTVPEFGFAPPRDHDRVIGLDLDCRPCAIHGGESCPLDHFDCMKKLSPELLYKVANEMI